MGREQDVTLPGIVCAGKQIHPAERRDLLGLAVEAAIPIDHESIYELLLDACHVSAPTSEITGLVRCRRCASRLPRSYSLRNVDVRTVCDSGSRRAAIAFRG